MSYAGTTVDSMWLIAGQVGQSQSEQFLSNQLHITYATAAILSMLTLHTIVLQQSMMPREFLIVDSLKVRTQYDKPLYKGHSWRYQSIYSLYVLPIQLPREDNLPTKDKGS